MTMKARKELLAALSPMYLKVSWKEKQQVLDSFVAATGYNRKHAIVLLNGGITPSKGAQPRARKYDDKVTEALIVVWKASNRICSKRLVPFLPTIISSMERFGHLNISQDTRDKLLSLSHASTDRLLKQERKKYARRKSTTRPGYLLKKHIPIRTYADWNDVTPGFFEADLVAHGGSSASGQFLQTLTMTDIATGWTECFALLSKSEVSVLRAFTTVKASLPFPLLGLDTDNGSEFINHAVLNWCTEHNITFTRSREYKKNDQAHVEEKNGSVVRRLIGYDRFEGESSWRLLTMLYQIARLYVNFFQPSLKLSSKERDGGNVKRIYDAAATPYQRIIGSSHVLSETKTDLGKLFNSLDPLLLLTELERLQAEFWSTAVPVNEAPSQSILKQFIQSSKPQAARAAAAAPTPTRPRHARRKDWVPTVPYLGNKRGKKTSLDEVWSEVCQELDMNPEMTPRQVLGLLDQRYPGRFRATQLTTITDKVRCWRHEHSLPLEFEKLKPGRKSNLNEIWQLALDVLKVQPNISCRGLHRLLMDRYPSQVNPGQRTSLLERHKGWRQEHMQQLDALAQSTGQSMNVTIFEEALHVVSQIQRN